MKTLFESDVRRLVMSAYQGATGKYVLCKDVNILDKFGEDVYLNMIDMISDKMQEIYGIQCEVQPYNETFEDILFSLKKYYKPERYFTMTERQEAEFDGVPRNLAAALLDLVDDMLEDGSPTSQSCGENLKAIMVEYFGEWE